jgi:hypothetical protein
MTAHRSGHPAVILRLCCGDVAVMLRWCSLLLIGGGYELSFLQDSADLMIYPCTWDVLLSRFSQKPIEIKATLIMIVKIFEFYLTLLIQYY